MTRYPAGHASANFIAYRDFFVRKIRQTPGVRFINATEGGILTDAVELLSLKDALHQSCKRPIPLPLGEAGAPKAIRVRVAVEHLHQVLKTRNTACSCLSGFLDLTAKEHLLKNNKDAIETSIRWGVELCELSLSLEPDSLEVGAGSRYARQQKH